jgi:hypothetical protein
MKHAILKYLLSIFEILCLGIDQYFINESHSGSSVGTVTSYLLEHRGIGVRVPGRLKNFHFSISSRPALGPTRPPIQRVDGLSFLRGKAAWA